MKTNPIALIPARGGSKGIPRKNMVNLANKPLIYYSIEAALSSKRLGGIYVSTDDCEILEYSRTQGARAIVRPAILASDTASVFSLLEHFVTELEEAGETTEMIVLLQPTSPLRKTETIDRAIAQFSEHYDEYDSLMPLSPFSGKIGRIKDGTYIPSTPSGARRQDVETLFKECGTIFIYKPSMIKNGNACGKRIMPFVVDNKRETIDIDTPDDLEEARLFLGDEDG